MTFYVRFNPQITPPTSGIFYSKADEKSDFEKLVPTDFSQYDPSDAEHVGWYYIPVNAKKPIWLDPYLNSNINVYMVSYVVPLFKDGKSIGIVGMDIDFKNIQNIIKNTKVYDSGYAFLLNSKYGIMSHPELNINDNLSTIENGSMKAVTDKMNQNSDLEGQYSYTYKGISKNLNYTHLSNGWIFALTAPSTEILKQSNSLIKTISIFIIIGIILTGIVAFYLGNVISKPIAKITAIVKRAGNLDLTYDNDFDHLLKYKDEIASMSEELTATINQVSEAIQNTAETAQKSSENAETIKDSIDQTTESIEQVSLAAHNQAELAEKLNEMVNRFKI